MMRVPFLFPAWLRLGCLLLFTALPRLVLADSASITGLDAYGKTITVNGTGHFTLVMYTNPDLEDDSRALTLALDSYRANPKFAFVRVVDLRGGVPPGMRSIVRVHIREEETKEKARLKKAGIVSSNPAPIIPDFTGPTLDALAWSSIYEQIHVVVYDPAGKEVKRLENVSDPAQVTGVMGSLL